MLTFKIDQVALCPPDPEAALALLKAMGLTEWVHDHVAAAGQVHSKNEKNEADLSFNYTGLENARELEILSYTEGVNWMMYTPSRASHLGMHCGAEELKSWRAFFSERGIGISQEVFTKSHTNPAIAGERTYNYVIFNTYPILGIDVKFIVRYSAKDGYALP